MSQKFTLKNINKIRNYLIEEINQNKLMSKKHKKICTTLNYSVDLFILASALTEYVSISAFASLVGILRGITSSAVILKICTTAGIKKYKSIIKIKKER